MLRSGQSRVPARPDVDAHLADMLAALVPDGGFAPFHAELDLLNLEGTGRVSVLQRAAPDYAPTSAARSDIATIIRTEAEHKAQILRATPALHDLRQDMRQYALSRKSLSSFYRIAVSGFTDFWLRRGLRAAEIVYLTDNAYGVAYSDLVYRACTGTGKAGACDERVAAYVPTVFTPAELEACTRLLEINHPVPALKPPLTHDLHPVLARLDAATPKPSGSEWSVCFYADYDSVTPALAGGICAAFAKGETSRPTLRRAFCASTMNRRKR
jgi:hypothetical protein